MAHQRRVPIHIDREEDGRFIAEIDGSPGILAYGRTEKEAVLKAAKLYLRALIERLSEGEEQLVEDLFAVSTD